MIHVSIIGHSPWVQQIFHEFTYNKYWVYLLHTYGVTLLFVPFVSKLVNIRAAQRSEKVRAWDQFCFNSVKASLLTESSKTYCGSNDKLFLTQKVPKEALFNGQKMWLKFYSKMFYLKWPAEAVKYSFITKHWLWSKAYASFCYLLYKLEIVY